MNGNVYHVHDLFVLLSFGVGVMSPRQGICAAMRANVFVAEEINVRGRMRGEIRVLRARGKEGLYFEIRESERQW